VSGASDDFFPGPAHRIGIPGPSRRRKAVSGALPQVGPRGDRPFLRPAEAEPAPASAERVEADDVRLLRRAAAGDEHAVRRLYRAHVGRVHGHVARVLGRLDGDVEDVVQQVFIAALDGAGKFDGRSRVQTWLIGIATRKALDTVRARQRRARWDRIRERVGLGRPAARPDERHGALAWAEAALAELTAEQRSAFLLHEVEGYTLAEIAELSKSRVSTVHARIKAAKKRLDRWTAGSGDAGSGEPGSGEQGGDRGSAA
jgi:RNA polymerase sigma-70 factor (ECF subfamily)